MTISKIFSLQVFSIAVVLLLIPLSLTGCTESTEPAPAVPGGEEEAPEPEMSDDIYFPLPDKPGETVTTEKLDFYVQTVVDGLSVPWGMAFLPDSIMLITERDGTLRLVREGKLAEEPVSGVPEVYARGQGGLLDVERHPDYEENGWIYLSYSKPGNGGASTAIIRARYDEEAHALTGHEEIYEGRPRSTSGRHFGSRIAFDPDGYLFFSIGDRGQMNTAQDITVSNGSLFRLYDDGRIPEDNPFTGRDGLDEIYTYGLRNIQGMAVHPETGMIWTNEHGPQGGDEINVHDTPGANFGWPEITYGVNYGGEPITEHTEMEGMEQPVMHWTPSIAPSGMDFVTSDRYPGWKGDILNGALKFQLISRVELNGDEFAGEERFLEGIGRIRDIRQGPDGFIYFSNESDGTIQRIVPVQ